MSHTKPRYLGNRISFTSFKIHWWITKMQGIVSVYPQTEAGDSMLKDVPQNQFLGPLRVDNCVLQRVLQ